MTTSVLYTFHFILHILTLNLHNLLDYRDYYLHFINKDTKVQKVNSLKSTQLESGREYFISISMI